LIHVALALYKICGKSLYKGMFFWFTLNDLFAFFGSSSENIQSEMNLLGKWKEQILGAPGLKFIRLCF